MAYDTHSNFGYGTVVTAPSPATSGTTIVIGTSTFTEFPDPATNTEYNVTIWPTGTFPLAANAEIARVVGKATVGTLYLSRAQESTNARTVVAGDQFAINITKKFGTDIEQYAPQDGWYAANETWTFAGSASPVFTVTTPGTVTSKYNAGMRVKLTSGGSIQYYLMHADPTVASGSSTLTLYGGTAYSLGTAAITSNFYSFHKSPKGFNNDPMGWTVRKVSSTNQLQASPGAGTWYNTGGTDSQIVVPIGAWKLSYGGLFYTNLTSGTAISSYITLGTSATAETETDLTARMYSLNTISGAMMTFYTRSKYINRSAVGTYYFIWKSGVANAANLGLISEDDGDAVLEATSSYL